MTRRLTSVAAALVAVGRRRHRPPRRPRRTRSASSAAPCSRPASSLKDDVRFAPRKLKVKSGATVTLVNKGTDPAPHTISFVKPAFLPKGFEFAAVGPLMAAHQVDEEDEEAPPGVLKVDNGAAAADQNAPLNVDQLGDDKQAGDSQFIAPDTKRITFKVTAKKGSKLPYYCAVHPWMQGKITVK